MHFSFLKQLFENAGIRFHPKTLQPESLNIWKFSYITIIPPNSNNISMYNSSVESIDISPSVCIFFFNPEPKVYPLHLVVRSLYYLVKANFSLKSSHYGLPYCSLSVSCFFLYPNTSEPEDGIGFLLVTHCHFQPFCLLLSCKNPSSLKYKTSSCASYYLFL